MADSTGLTTDYVVRVAVSCAILGLSVPASAWLGRRLLGDWYTTYQDSLQVGIAVGVLAGFGIARDYGSALIFIALVVSARFLHKWRDVRARRAFLKRDRSQSSVSGRPDE